jgi:hypothetical protein
LSEFSFPSESKEAIGHVKHCGHALTYRFLSSESDVIIYQSLLCHATPDDANVRACMSGGESPTHVGPYNDRSYVDKSTLASTPTDEDNAESPPSPIFNEQEDGQRFRGRIVELIEEHESKAGR